MSGGRAPTVAIVVSGHGFGHSVRCAAVAQALLARGARVRVHTDAPRALYPSEAEYHRVETDVGVVQRGGLDFDIDATRRAWQAFESDFADRVSLEAATLRAQRADFVLGDIPALAFAAAAEAGLPSAALGNFTWDWIYAAWPDFEPAVERIRASYALADRLFRLPLHSLDREAFCAFREIEDVPLVARHASLARADARSAYDLPLDARVVLLSFGGFHAEGLNLDAFGEWRDYLFVVTPPVASEITSAPPNVRIVDRQPDDYVSFFAACDAVITKPGYGVVADALANRVAVLFTDRGPFREYPVLAEALPRLGRARYIPQPDLLAGQVGRHLDALFALPDSWTSICTSGADVVAARVLELVGTART